MERGLRKESSNQKNCQLCKRELSLSFHHLIPRLTHKRRWVQQEYTSEQLQRGIWVCHPCHSAIHRFIAHMDLSKTYNSLETLLSHEELGKFVRWSQKQRRAKKVRRRKL
jgi:hypothetical protein